jgi:hypothetical protein
MSAQQTPLANGLLHHIDSNLLVILNGDGHSLYLLNRTTAAAINNYLVNGIFPEPGTVYNSYLCREELIVYASLMGQI